MIVALTNLIDYIQSTELARSIVIYPKIVTVILVGTVMTMKIYPESVNSMRSTDSSKTVSKWLENGRSHSGWNCRKNDRLAL